MRTKDMTKTAVCYAIFIFLFAILLEIVLKTFKIENISIKYLIMIVVTLLLFYIPSCLLAKKQGINRKKFFKLKKFKLRWMGVIVTASLCATFGGILLNALMLSLNLPSSLLPSTVPQVPAVNNLFLFILAVVIVPAAFEEIFFRGAMLNAFLKRGQLSAVMGCAFCFALLHSSPFNFLAPLFAGIVYGLLTIMFDSIYPAIIAHLINNTLSALALFYYKRFLQIGISALFFVGAILVFLILLYISLKLIEPYLSAFKKTEKPKALKERLKYNENSPVFSGPIFILAGIWILKLVVDIFIAP